MVFFILATIGFMVSVILRIADTVLPQIATTFQISIGDTSAVITAFSIVHGICQLIHGGLGDHFGKLKVVFISSILGEGAGYVSLRLFGKLGDAVFLSRSVRRSNGTQIRLSNYTSLLKSKSFRHIFMVYLIEGIALFGAIGYASALMRDRFDLSYTQIGLLLSGFGIGRLMFSLSVKFLLKIFSLSLFLIFAGWSHVGLT